MPPVAALPVLVGVGAVTRHPGDLDATGEPADLVAEAIRVAADDAGLTTSALADVDAVEVLNLLSWKYADPAGAVAARIGAERAQARYSDIGGEQPTALIDAAAERIARGESRLAVVAGGETLASRRLWGRSGQEPPWTPPGEPPFPIDFLYGVGHGLAEAGLADPSQVYPLFDNAHAAARGWSATDALAASGRIWAAMSVVAAHTPTAWDPEVHTEAEIITPSAANRPIAHPYLKLMCAQPMVDQAGAVLIASTAEAQRLGIPEDRWVYPWAGAGVVDTSEVLDRPSLASSEPLRRSITDALDLAGLAPSDVAARELYSCFPIVPKLALEVLGQADTDPATVAGGLTFYGGPLNAYMVCAAVAMVRAVRQGRGPGLLYGNGGYLTKHHALVVGAAPPPGGRFVADERTARQANMDRRPRPAVSRVPSGPASVETWTVVYDRDGTPARGVVIGRLDDGPATRFAARVEGGADVLGWMVAGVDQAIGRPGTASTSEDGRVRFRFA